MTVSSQLCAFEVCLLCRVWWRLFPSADDPSPFIHSQLMLFNAQKDTAQGRSATNMSPRTGLSLLLPHNCSQGRAAAWAQAHAGPLLLGFWTGPEKPAALAAVPLSYSIFQHEVFFLFQGKRASWEWWDTKDTLLHTCQVQRLAQESPVTLFQVV